MDNTKPAWQSRTLLLNGLFGLIVFISLFVPQAAIVKTYIDAHAELVAMVWSALNMALRFITKDKIVLTD